MEATPSSLISKNRRKTLAKFYQITMRAGYQSSPQQWSNSKAFNLMFVYLKSWPCRITNKSSQMKKINHIGMRTGIVKIIPPKEWKDSLPPLDEAIKTIKVKDPIAQ